MNFFQRFMVVVTLCFGSVAAQLLYDPEPPANSAFVRIVHNLDSSQKIQLGSLSFDTVPSFSVSAYRVVPQGKQFLIFMGKKN